MAYFLWDTAYLTTITVNVLRCNKVIKKAKNLVSLEADPFKRRFLCIIVIVGSTKVFLGLSQETLRLRWLRVDATERRRNVEVCSTGAVLAREVLLVALTLSSTNQPISE